MRFFSETSMQFGRNSTTEKSALLHGATRLRGMKIAPLGLHTRTETGEKIHDRSAERRAVSALTAGDRSGRGGNRDAQARPADRHGCAPPRSGSAEVLCMPGPPRAGRAV